MLNEHPLKIRINTLDDMFRQINILGNAEINKYKQLLDIEYDNYIWWYGKDTEYNIRINRRLDAIYCVPNRNLAVYIYVWLTGEIIIQTLYINDVKKEEKCVYTHLGKFFTKKQMNELKNYMIQHYDKDEFGDYQMKELKYKEN